MVLYHKFKFTEFQDLDTDSRTDTTCPVGTGYMLNTLILQMWNYKGIAQETVSSWLNILVFASVTIAEFP